MSTNNVLKNMPPRLVIKAIAMNSFSQQRALMNSVAYMTYESGMPEDMAIKMRAAIQNGREKAYLQLHAEAKLNAIPMYLQISALREAPLTEKRQVLDSLPIIPVSVGAAFLGIAEADLHDLNSQNFGVFGDIYMRRRCNSVNELLLIAQNPGWLRYRLDGAPPLKSPDYEMLYAITYVDICTAMAYTNMSWQEMKNQVKGSGRYQRYDCTYRVSDLEQLRIAKLETNKK